MDKFSRTLRKLVSFNLSPFWETMSRNWIMKILCLVLAFVVWQGVRENTSYEVVVADVPVTVIAGEGRAVLDQSTDVVNIRFRGSREDIRFISSDQISVKVDISRRQDKLRQVVKFAPRFVKGPSQAHAVQFDPPEITVTMDREVERVLPVKAVFEGELPAGIQLENTLCSPASVRVRGAEQLLRDLEQVRTAPISLDGRFTSFKVHVSVDASGQPWTASPERVAVDVNLVERTATRRLENIYVRPLLASDDSRSVKIRPEKISVVLGGSPQRVEEVTDRDVYAYIDCSELVEPTDYEVAVRVDVPKGLRVEKTEPPAVKVSVKKL